MADNYLGEDDDINGEVDENFSDGEYGAEIEDNYGLVKNPYKDGYGNQYDNNNNNYDEDNEEDDIGGNYQLEGDDIGNYGGNYDMDDDEEQPKRVDSNIKRPKRVDPDDIKRPKSSEEKAADRYERELAELISLRTTSWDSSLSRMHKTFQEISVDESKNLNNNWTEVYEKLMEEKDSYQKFKNLAQLARDFNYAADIYGKIIINELCLENEKKTIKPVSIGGIAGGSKYIICGILFKFALDVYGIYGYNDDGAMKAAAHELRGVIQINSANVPNLHTPLMCLIDYKGFRLIAMSLINIDETSLVYGSADGGKTVHKSSPEACSAVKLLAQHLNLKKHQCGFERLSLCCDTEVHQIKKSFYIIDSARLFPPEAKSDKTVPMGKGEWLFRLLRPELVKSNPVPLSSDAFSTFQSKDPDKIIHNNEVREATLRLIQSAFPNLVSQLEKIKSSDIYKQNLGKIFHSCGVNLRKMGEIRHLTKNNPLREMILCYMVIRACKELIHLQMRNTMWKLEVPRDEIFKEIHLNLLNNLFAGKDKEKSKSFWMILKDLIVEKYGLNSLTEEEKRANYHLRESIKMDINLFRVYHICFPSVILNKELIDIIRYESNEDLLDITFVQGDIIELTSIVKQTNITYYAEAMALKSIAETKGLGHDAVERLKKRAALLLSFAVNVSSNFDSLLQSALHNYQRRKLPKALSDFEAANQIDPNNSTARVYLGVVLARSDSKNYTEAAKQWEIALSLSPPSLDPFLTLSRSFVYSHHLFSGDDLNTLLQIIYHSKPLIQRAIQLGKFKEVNMTGLSLIDDRIFIHLLQNNLFDQTEKLILRSVKITDKSVVLFSRLTHLRHLDLSTIPNIPLSSILSLPKSIEVLVLPIGQFDISHLENVFGSSSLQRKFLFPNMYLCLRTNPSSHLYFDNHPNPSLITTREDRSEVIWFSSFPFSSPPSSISEFHKDEEWGKFLIHENEKKFIGVVEFAIFRFDFSAKTATKVIDTPHKKEVKFFSYSNQKFCSVDETGLLIEYDLQFTEIRRLKLVDPDHPSHSLEDFAITPNHFVTGQFGSPSLCIFDSSSGDFQRKIEIKGGDFIANIKAEGDKVYCRCIGQNGPDLFYIFDISTGAVINQIILPDLYSIRDFKIDDHLLYIANGVDVIVCDLNGKLVHTIDQSVGSVNGIYFINGLILSTSSSSNAFQTTFLHLSFLHSVELHRKCAIESAEEVKKELQLHPLDLNAADFRGYTALHFAALRGNMEILDLLIAARANPKLQTLQKKTALEYAKERGDYDESNSFVAYRWNDVISRLAHYTQNYEE